MRIAGKEFSSDILALIFTIIGTSFGGVWWLSASEQKTVDAINTLSIRVSHLEQSQTDIAHTAAASAAAVSAIVDRNESRRDMSDQEQRAAINRLTDRVDKLSNDLATREHSELLPLPRLANAAPDKAWNGGYP